MFEELFRRKAFRSEKALQFGFVKTRETYRYATDILNGTFRLETVIAADGSIRTELRGKETDEEYILYKTNAPGTFVGEVRSAVENVLLQIADHCFETEIFHSPQAKEAIAYVRKTYDDELEFLWKKIPR